MILFSVHKVKDHLDIICYDFTFNFNIIIVICFGSWSEHQIQSAKYILTLKPKLHNCGLNQKEWIIVGQYYNNIYYKCFTEARRTKDKPSNEMLIII